MFEPPVRIEELIRTPAHSLIDQSQAATESKFTVNGDGYSFFWYVEDGRLAVYNDILPAWGDSNLTIQASMITSPLILAHVRASTYAENSRSNCHRFVSGRWSFMHNGQIANFSYHRRALEKKFSDELFAQRIDNTDSELLFLLLLTFGFDNNVPEACCFTLEVISRITADCAKPNRITIVFSDGNGLYALKTSSDMKSPSLYFKPDTEGAARVECGDLLHNIEPTRVECQNYITFFESVLKECANVSPLLLLPFQK